MFLDRLGKALSEAKRIANEFEDFGLMGSMVLNFPISDATANYQADSPIPSSSDS
jgi:hypothetical protein